MTAMVTDFFYLFFYLGGADSSKPLLHRLVRAFRAPVTDSDLGQMKSSALYVLVLTGALGSLFI